MIDTNVVIVSGKIVSSLNYDESKKILNFSFRSFQSEVGYRSYAYFTVYMFGARAEKNVGVLRENNPYIIKGRLSSFKVGSSKLFALVVVGEYIYKLDKDWYEGKDSASDDIIVPM